MRTRWRLRGSELFRQWEEAIARSIESVVIRGFAMVERSGAMLERSVESRATLESAQSVLVLQQRRAPVSLGDWDWQMANAGR